MRRVLIRHLSGSKANQIDSLNFEDYREVLIGRDHGVCKVAFDEDRDEKVSGRHAKITQNPNEPNLFSIEDLRSRNGTFLDGRMIDGPAPLRHGCKVQLGRSGPAFIFETDPPPSGPKPTVADLGDAEGTERPWWERARQTIGDWAPRGSEGEKRRWTPGLVIVCSAAALLCLAIVFAVALYLTRPMSSAAVLEANGRAVASIDVSWKLFDTETGRQAYHWHVQNPFSENDPRSPSLKGKIRVPVFIRMPDGALEPVLILDDERDTNRALGGRAVGSGCVVDERGFILTSSSIAAPFTSEYTWPNGTFPALAVDPNNQAITVLERAPTGWIPSGARFVITRRVSLEALASGRVQPTGRAPGGRVENMMIAFSGTDHRITAKPVRTSENIALSVLKIDPIRTLRAAEMARDKRNLAVAARAYVVGYSADVTPAKQVAGRLAGVLNLGESNSAGRSFCPGCYEISDSGADFGYAGGPVFDDHGRVVGVFQPSNTGKERTFWVIPIERAFPLLEMN